MRPNIKTEVSISALFSRMFLVPVFLFAISIHLIQWSMGISFLNADEYITLYNASAWAQYPALSAIDISSPFFVFFLGLFIKITGSIFWGQSILMLFFTMLFMAYFYKFSLHFTKESLPAIFSLALIISSALFMRVFTLPLAEAGALTFTVMSLYYLFKWHESSKESKPEVYLLLTSQFLMFIAAGFRPECWLIALASSVFIIYSSLKHDRKRIVLNAALSLIPILFPVAWLISLKFYFGDTSSYLGIKKELKFTNLFAYPKYLAYQYTMALILMHASFLCFASFLKESKRVFLIVLNIAFFIFLGFSSLLYAKAFPERSLLFLMIFLVPFVSTGTFILFKKYAKASAIISFILTFGLIASALLSFFKFTKPPDIKYGNAREVALYLKNTAKKGKIADHSRILVERVDFDWCIIYVESDLYKRILFDRKSKAGLKTTLMPSQLSQLSKDDFSKLVKNNRFSYFVFKSTPLIEMIRKNLPITEETKIGDYYILRYINSD